jgi:rare lipoprotein A (peptidoglycan hydrolase)
MLFQLPTSAVLLALAVLAEASSSHGHGAHLANMRRRQLNPRGPQVPDAIPARASLGRRSCRKPASHSSAAPAATHPATPVANLGDNPTDPPADKPTPPSTPTTSTKKTAETTHKPDAPQTGGVAAGNFVPVKPADWPTATQAKAVPTAVRTSAADPYLMELSKAIDNSQNPQFTKVHVGQMTYYGQGLGACGDVYDDQSYTAAVSKLMYDSWPGADGAQNRNPICGPFVPGRKTINNAGTFSSAVTSSLGYVLVGGDGLLNCVGSTNPRVQCHVPLTATVTHGGKSIQVKIVDRCEDCAEDDIDLTPAAFAAIADPALGRTDVKWQFNNW